MPTVCEAQGRSRQECGAFSLSLSTFRCVCVCVCACLCVCVCVCVCVCQGGRHAPVGTISSTKTERHVRN